MKTTTVYDEKAALAVAKINLREEKNRKEKKAARIYGTICILFGILSGAGAIVFTRKFTFLACCIIFLVFGIIEFYSSSKKKMTQALTNEVQKLPFFGGEKEYEITGDFVKMCSEGMELKYSWDMVSEWGYEDGYIYLKTKDNRLMLFNREETEIFIKGILYEKEIFPVVEKAEDINTLVTEEDDFSEVEEDFSDAGESDTEEEAEEDVKESEDSEEPKEEDEIDEVDLADLEEN